MAKQDKMVTGRQQVTNRDGETINLRADQKQEASSTRQEKARSGMDSAGSNLPGKQNAGKPFGRKGDL